MNDSNWKKLIQLIFQLCQKYKNVVELAKESHTDFKHINDSADPQMVQRWPQEDAMDIFDLRISTGV
jgi:hypothetical protein